MQYFACVQHRAKRRVRRDQSIRCLSLCLLPEDSMVGKYRRLKVVECGQCDDKDEERRVDIM